MEAIADYIRNIALYMVFSALVEIVSPSGSFKKYIRLILSLVLIMLLIEPVGVLMYGGGRLEENYLKFQNLFDNKMITAERGEYEKQQAEAVLAEYKKNMDEKTVQIIETRTGLSVSEARVVVNEDYESADFASVLGVHVTAVIPKDDTSAVKKLLFGNSAGGETGGEIASAAESKIKNCLADFYNTPESNIHITVQDNGLRY